ncbi:hypothetical protein BJY00DRAFT_317641 [Aspergillus carlsbadensis]|nr:hypothetical protein BJY00DRAFT_317641 [Aspergillus carlsbadensis]
MDKATVKVFASTCSDKLTSSPGDDFISLDLDSNGGGDTIVDGRTYLVHENPDISGSITCMQIFDADELFVRCDDVPVPISTLPTAALAVKEDCFAYRGAGISMRLPEVADASENSEYFSYEEIQRLANTAFDFEAHDSPLHEPQTNPCSIRSESTGLVGNGDPHQNYCYTQISENIACGTAPSCSFGYQKTKSFIIGWSTSSAYAPWIFGGLAVAKSWSTGNSYTCSGAPTTRWCVSGTTRRTQRTR